MYNSDRFSHFSVFWYRQASLISKKKQQNKSNDPFGIRDNNQPSRFNQVFLNGEGCVPEIYKNGSYWVPIDHFGQTSAQNKKNPKWPKIKGFPTLEPYLELATVLFT